MSYAISTIARIAIAEILGRHRRELQDAVLAARAMSDLPDGDYDLNLDQGVWIPRPVSDNSGAV